MVKGSKAHRVTRMYTRSKVPIAMQTWNLFSRLLSSSNSTKAVASLDSSPLSRAALLSISRAVDHIPTTVSLGQAFTVEILVKYELKMWGYSW